jgi:putative transposase
MSGQLANGRRFRVLNVVDDFSRECVLQLVDFSISGHRLVLEFDQLRRKLPRRIVCGNGPEFAWKAMFFWARRVGVKLHFIQPGKPTQNAFVDTFNGKFRHYCLDLNWFASLEDARLTIDTWRNHYNHVRPHRSLGKKPPACSLEKLPDMLNLPHRAVLESRGAVTTMKKRYWAGQNASVTLIHGRL